MIGVNEARSPDDAVAEIRPVVTPRRVWCFRFTLSREGVSPGRLGPGWVDGGELVALVAGGQDVDKLFHGVNLTTALMDHS